MSDARNYFEFIVKQIHTVVLASSDEEGNPVTCAVDVMDCDDDNLYFLTARGKALYGRLKSRRYVSLTGVKGDGTLKSVAVTVQGRVRECGGEILQRLLEKNAYMYEIYPTEQSRKALSAFAVCCGTGEFFDLSSKPVKRQGFSFGAERGSRQGYFVGEGCTGCGKCAEACPQNCIDIADGIARIRQENCLSCGNCSEVCPEKAVRRM